MTQFNTKKGKVHYVNGYYSATAYPHIEVDGQQVGVIGDLEQHPSAKCWVLYCQDKIYLQSYDTIVSTYDRATKTLTERKYSPTTSKQQTWFACQIHTDFGLKERKVEK